MLDRAIQSAQNALALVHADTREFIVHLDTDVLDAAELPSVNVPGTAGLKFADARAILQEIVRHKNLLGLDIAQYNPDKDPDGSGAKKLVDLLVAALTARIESSETSVAAPAAEAGATTAATTIPEAAASTPADNENAAASDAAAPAKEGMEIASDAGPSESSESSEEPADSPEISSSQSSSS